MALKQVPERGLSVRLACAAFGISETCYYCQPKLSDENIEIAGWLIRLAHNQRDWGLICVFCIRLM